MGGRWVGHTQERVAGSRPSWRPERKGAYTQERGADSRPPWMPGACGLTLLSCSNARVVWSRAESARGILAKGPHGALSACRAGLPGQASMASVQSESMMGLRGPPQRSTFPGASPARGEATEGKGRAFPRPLQKLARCSCCSTRGGRRRQAAGAVQPRGRALGAAAANPIAWSRGSQTRRAAGQPKLELSAAAPGCSAYERNRVLQLSTPPLHGCRNPYSASLASRFPLSAGKVLESSQMAGCGFRSDAEDGSARGGVRNHPPILFHIRGRFGSSV